MRGRRILGTYRADLLGEPLLHRPFAALRAWFKSVDDEVELLADGLRSIKLGTSIYASAAKDPERPNDGAMVFRRGYFNGV